MTDKKYRLETTEDGTATIYADEFSEAMHSTSGAYEEALLKHIYPSKILDSPKKNLKVLDIGFGLGYNILALLMELSAKRPGTGLTIISFEKDRTYLPLLETIQFHDEKAPVYEIIKKAFKEGEYSENNLSIKIHFGDARESLRLLQETGFDALFQDPFSPSKNPELWSLEFFRELYRVAGAGSVLTTYSSAPQVRMALLEAGFTIGKGPSVGKKREGTIASKGEGIIALAEEEIRALRENVKSTPYRDFEFSSRRDTILSRRIEEMRVLREGNRWP